MFTIKLTARDTSGVGRTYLRASDPEALSRRVEQFESRGLDGRWVDDETGLADVYLVKDPDGHEIGLYWETEWYVPPDELRPSLKNQAARFPGANVRRLDHVNYLAADVPANTAFFEDYLGVMRTEQILSEEGAPAAV